MAGSGAGRSLPVPAVCFWGFWVAVLQRRGVALVAAACSVRKGEKTLLEVVFPLITLKYTRCLNYLLRAPQKVSRSFGVRRVWSFNFCLFQDRCCLQQLPCRAGPDI